MVVWLLSHGADPNGDVVMYNGAWCSTADILELLIDAGGDVNRMSAGEPPLFTVLDLNNCEDKVRVLLAQPSLDCTIKYCGKTPEEFARNKCKPALADMIAQEVSGKLFRRSCFARFAAAADSVCGVAMADRWRDERRWYDQCYLTHIVWCRHGETCCRCGVVAVS